MRGGDFIQLKVFAIVCVLLIALGSVFAFAEPEHRSVDRSVVSASPNQIYVLRSEWATTAASMGTLYPSFEFSVGTLENGFYTEHLGGFNRLKFENGSLIAFDNHNTNPQTVLANGTVVVYNALKIETSGTASSVFSAVYTLGSASGSIVVDSVKEFFSGALFGGGVILSFLSASWLSIIPLVLWIGIALYGIFRHLSKGVG